MGNKKRDNRQGSGRQRNKRDIQHIQLRGNQALELCDEALNADSSDGEESVPQDESQSHAGPP